ncbi:PREDICTED: uncharacterized protein LOC109345190 isoform X1 [Lupinus angustifolius]|uniref:uncharacterized protein LOC109345190 isoform X1 n=1 Tax=Lupinus angustifolius TaxID=3871 RepID=UPI00092E5B84|nr:PREDICTED: uncharacterized protein LOC109345190 isoform X1 [Lupinus angustifolius]
MIYIYIGDKGKRESMFEEEIEQTERRRSTRIIALEERKQVERDRKLALARKNNSTNQENRNKGKEKVHANLDYSNDVEEHGPGKKGRKSNELEHVTSSTKEEQHPGSGGSSRKNESSQNSIPEKHVLESILDALQRKDREELFAMPVISPNVVEEGHDGITKQPMDFGTMRAKLHEGMYTNLEQFKHDIYSICFSAMNGNPGTSRYHKVAEAIYSHARRLLEGLSADPQEFGLTLSLNKRCPNRNPQDGQPRTSRHARLPPKPAGRKKATHSMVHETQRRDMYWPPSNDTLVSDFVNANKFNIQLIADASNYRASLLRFVEDLGPVAKRVAAQKLQSLNLIDNVPGTEILHPTASPHSPTKLDTPNNTEGLPLALSLANNTPKILHASADHENRNDNNTIAVGVNINDGADNSWSARAAAILGNIFINNDKGKSLYGYENSNAVGTMGNWGPSKGKMVSTHENMFSFQEGTIHNRNGNNTGHSNTSAGSSRTVFTRVWPTQVIPPKPLESITGNNSRPVLSFMQQPRAEDYYSMPNTSNLLELSLMPQQLMPTYSMPLINESVLSLASHHRPEDYISIKPTINLTGQSHVPEHSMYSGINSHSGLSLMPHLELGGSSNPRNSVSGKSVFSSQDAMLSNWDQPDTLFGLGTPYEHGDFDALMSGSSSTQYFNNTPYPIEASYEQVLQHAPSSYTPPPTFFDSPMHLIREPNQQSLFHQPEPEISLDHGMPLGSALNYNEEGAALVDQPQEVTRKLLPD